MRESERDRLYQPIDLILPFRMIIAPFHRQAELFIKEMGFYPPECKVAREPVHLRGYRLDQWEVWWLDRMWPCRTHEDVEKMLHMKMLARMYGADIHHWWT
jgi:hypothetical protein